ncbi:hypothetical protein RMSM_07099 [Rhodopirellula maiorica SM1]|uniref:Uncharacterized protein n=1 Tax=Rhodopirellula maiorica SM1 TaxID=1265738 RepID=M5R909_9BACT|nr:hypothetical protein RMSM_07099 [Rhodopirellula maiorica SM1]
MQIAQMMERRVLAEVIVGGAIFGGVMIGSVISDRMQLFAKAKSS